MQISSTCNEVRGIRLCATILRALVEEFSNEEIIDTHMSMEQHRRAYQSFTKNGIDYVFSSTLDMLARVFQALQSADRQNGATVLLETINTTAEVSKLLTETLMWNFSPSDTTTVASVSGTSLAKIIIDLPRAWGTPLLSSPLVSAIFDAYDFIRQLFVSAVSSLSSHQVACVLAALAELRQNIVALTSVSSSGKLFDRANGGDGLVEHFGESLLSRLVPLLSRMLPNLEDGGSQFHQGMRDLHDQECLGVSMAVLRLVGNFKLATMSRMKSFEEMVLALARCCHSLSGAMASAAESRYRSVLSRSSSSHPLLVEAEGGLLESRWGDVLTLLLEAWGLVLDDPLLLGLYGQLSSMQTEGGQAVSAGLRTALGNIAAQVFSSLLECVVNVELSDTLCDEQDDSDDGDLLQEHEDIGSRNREDLLHAIGTVGRACVGSALGLVLARLIPACDALQAGTAAALATTEQLETVRVCTVLASHLCMDSFTSAAASESSELPMMPPRVVDSLGPPDSALNKQLLVQLERVQTGLLHLQVEALRGRPAVASPLVIQTSLRFLSEYLRAYLDPDPSLYPTGATQAFPDAFALHNVGELNDILSAWLSCSHGLLAALPLEEAVVEGVADLLEALGSRPSFAHVVASSSGTLIILEHVGTDRYNLSSTGLAHVWRGVAALLSKGARSDLLEQLCEAVLQRFADRDPAGLLRLVATLTGLARCPPVDGLSKEVSGLFDRCVPRLLAVLPASDLDPNLVLESLLVLHRDYAEIYVPTLTATSIGRLCDCSLLLMRLVGDRLAAISSATSTLGRPVEELDQGFYLDSLLTCLQLLNHLATTDFTNDFLTPAESAAVTNTLFSAITIVAPFLTPDVLRAQPQLQDPYFSFLTYLLNSYSDWWLRLQSSGVDVLAGIIGQCVWVVGAFDGPVARMALGVLYVIVSQQVQAVGGGGNTVVLPEDCKALLSDALSRLLEILLYPAASESRGVSHKTDAFGHALAALIAYDSQRFSSVVNEVLARQSPGQREQLAACFGRLVSARNAQLGALSKQQRHIFVLNLRDFVVEISSLSLLR